MTRPNQEEKIKEEEEERIIIILVELGATYSAQSRLGKHFIVAHIITVFLRLHFILTPPTFGSNGTLE